MFEELTQLPEAPLRSLPISIIGAGGIVRDAHLPAYRIANFQVQGLYDLNRERAQALANEFGIPTVYSNLREVVDNAAPGTVFDIAVPASAIMEVLAAIPEGSPVLIQKPMGENLVQAKEILDYCREHGLVASINFQMRYAPYIRLAKEIIDSGAIGELHDIEVRLTVDTPWSLWTFLDDIPRTEILYHSIHYIDVVRYFCGEPIGVYAKSIGHPRMPRISQVRSTIVLDYGEKFRATITANHGHNFGPEHQESYIKWEGTKGAIVATLGLMLDYPRGKPDTFEVFVQGEGWTTIPLQGTWFPHAFIGPMASLMRFQEGSISTLPTSVQDAFKTMAVVESAFTSSESGATPIRYL